jgi:ABC-2 type transport system permease protein
VGFVKSFQTLWAITRREFALYFVSPIFYLVGGALLFISGLFFWGTLGQLQQSIGLGAEPSLRPTLGTIGFLMLFIAPLLTMRVVAEESRQGTLELLLTRPVRDWQVIVGKFLAAWGVVTVLLLLTTVYAFILNWGTSNPDQRVIMSGYLGLWLLSGAMLAIGVFMSSLTKYQLVAGMLGLVTLILLWVIDFFSQQLDSLFIGGQSGSISTFIVDAATNLSLVEHFRPSFLRGSLEILDIVYFVFLGALSLFLATRVLEARRWRA